MPPRVYHLCTDPCENHLAEGWGQAAGLEVQPLFPKDGMYPADGDGLVINLNYLGLTPLGRAQLARRTYLTVLPYPAAVSSFDLEPDTITALQDRGLLVARRLGPGLFQELARRIARKPADDEAAA
jgi:hypothetical protein